MNSPAFTMRSRTGSLKTLNIPGPCHYPKGAQKEIKWSVGKDKKGTDLNLKKSGSLSRPGAYDIKKGLTEPKWVFPSENRDKPENLHNPGPGQYDYFPSISNLPRCAAPK